MATDVENSNIIKHEAGNAYSSEITLNSLNEEMEALESQINDLKKAVEEAALKSKKLVTELRKKECIFKILNDKKNELNLQESQFKKASKKDEKIKNFDKRIQDKEAALEKIKDVNNVLVKREATKLEKQISKLKSKQGKIMPKQMKLTNAELIKYYKKEKKVGNKQGKENARNEFIKDRNDRIDTKKNDLETEKKDIDKTFNEAIDSGKVIKAGTYMVKSSVSYFKINLLGKYSKMLKYKDGKIEGLRRIPSNIKDFLKKNIVQPGKKFLNENIMMPTAEMLGEAFENVQGKSR